MSVTASNYVKLSACCGYFNTPNATGVVCTSTSVYIIDSGVTPQDGEDIVSAVTELFPGKKIAAVINTHSHNDHSGGNAAIVRLTGAQVWCSREADCILRLPELVGYLYSGGKPLLEIQEHGRVKSEPCKADKFLKETSITCEEITFTFVPLEGHFFGHYGIIADDGEKKVYYLGDGFFGKDMLKKAWLPFIYDADAFRKSVQKIESTDCDFYVAAHGGIYTRETVHAAAELNIIVTLEAELKILKLLKEAPMTHEQLLKKILDFAGMKPQLIQYLLIGTTIQSYLSCLHDRGLIKYKLEDNQMLWFNENTSDSDFINSAINTSE